MRIGVITYWYGDSNYGMLLQCWALQKYLKDMGHDPFVIRYRPKGPFIRRFAKSILNSILCYINPEKRVQKIEIENQNRFNVEMDKIRNFSQFREQHLVLSELYYEHLLQLRHNPPQADYYICGSDQIWSCHLKVNDSWGYYLAFGDKSTKRVAYAPSFGVKDYPQKMLKKLTKALSIFDKISCREFDGVNICKQAGFEAQKVEDPTLLLNATSYKDLLSDLPYRDHVFIYSVNMRSADDIYWDEVKSVFAGSRLVSTPSSGSIPGKELFGNDVEYVYATPGEWLSLINSSAFVITSSFHGVVFAILFNKRFAYVPLKGVHAASNNRVFDLLNSLGLDNQIVSSKEDYKRIKDIPIDWQQVNQKRIQLIENSKCYLQSSLD